MAVDIYVGSLVRYYSGLWENKIQRYSREKNLTYNIIKPESNSNTDNISRERIIELIRKWLENLSVKFDTDFTYLEQFQEFYFTERLEDFDIIFFSNCYLYSKDKDINSVFTRNGQKEIEKEIKKENIFVHLGEIDMWIPIKLNGSGVYTTDFNEDEKTFSTTFTLIEELNKICNTFFNCQISDLNKKNIFDEEKIYLKNDLIKFYDGATFSIKNNSIMVLDY